MTPPKPTAEELDAFMKGVGDLEAETRAAILEDVDDDQNGWSVLL